MRRREFNILLGGAATASTVWSSALRAQQKATAIGFLGIGTALTRTPGVDAEFRQVLSETG
jgi:hypothetical protein